MAATYRNREARLLMILIVLYSVTLVAFFVLARYRLPLIPILALFAASGVAGLVASVRERRLRTVMVCALCWVAAAGLCLRNLPFYSRQSDLAADWHNLGNLQMRVGRKDEALRSMENAVQLAPTNEYLLRDLGLLYLASSHLGQAEPMLLRCVAINPRRADAWGYLAKLYEVTNRPAQASQAYTRARKIDPGLR
jgi:tetratricopeptide (TPR) repeat protein